MNEKEDSGTEPSDDQETEGNFEKVTDDTPPEVEGTHGNEPDDETAPNEVAEEPESQPEGSIDTEKMSGTDRLEDIQDELRAKENEIDDVRNELEPKLREKEDEINELRTELNDRLAEHERRLNELREELRDEIKARRSPTGGAHSDRPAKAAGVVLAVTGLLGFVASVSVTAVTLSPSVTLPAIDDLGRNPALATAALSAVVSAVVLAGGWSSYRKRRWYLSVLAATLASLLATPLGLVALVLLAFSEPSFD
jgi:ElaB/YqjD/DUF883 family membrane-anchored ribosome-binding protein